MGQDVPARRSQGGRSGRFRGPRDGL